MEIKKKDIIKKDIVDEVKDGKIIDYSEGFFIVQKDNCRYYYVDAKTKKEIGPFAAACPFKEGYAAVEFIKGDCGYIDLKGNRLPINTNKIYWNYGFSEGYAKTGEKSFVDKDGNEKEYKPNNKIIKFVSPFKCGRAIVTYEIFGKPFYYFIDKNFERISNKTYDTIAPFNEDRAVVGKRTKRYIVDKDENIIFEYDLKKDDEKTSSSYSDGLIGYHKESKWGVLDKDGNVAIEPQFDHDITFSDGVAIYCQNDIFYIIDKEGNKKELLSNKNHKYDLISNFENGYAVLRRGSFILKRDVIDKAGNILYFDGNNILYDDYLVLSGQQKFIKIEDLKKLQKVYQIIITIGNNKIIKMFDTEEERDKYYDMLQEEIKKATELSNNVYNEYLHKMLEESDDRYSEFCTEKGKTYTKERKIHMERHEL